jgi:hypothetical protein
MMPPSRHRPPEAIWRGLQGDGRQPWRGGIRSELQQSLFSIFFFSNRDKGLSVLYLCKTKEKAKTDQKL